jgi:hypothetical protein
MTEGNTKLQSAMIEGIMNEISPLLTTGLSPEQAKWANDAYRGTILPYSLRFATSDTDSERQETGSIVIEVLKDALEGLSPNDKWTAVQEAYFVTRLSPISDMAFMLAQQCYRRETPIVELRQAAASTRVELRALIKEIEERNLRKLPALEVIIYESLLDIDYVIHRSDIISPRMDRFIEQTSQS